MARSLDANLTTAMDGIVRHPIVNLVSFNPVDKIPFAGYYISEESPEQEAKLLANSNGRLFYTYIKSNKLYYGYSDVDRTQWNHDNLVSAITWGGSGFVAKCADLCELSDGRVGIVFEGYQSTSTTGKVVYVIINADGSYSSYGVAATFTRESTYGIGLANTGSGYIYVRGDRTGSDPVVYHNYKNTSSNFTSWGTESDVSMSPLNTGYPVEDQALFKPINDNLILTYTYTEAYNQNNMPLTNIYYQVSTDNGATWGTPIKVTDNNGYDTAYYEPQFSQYIENSALFSFRKVVSSLYLGYTATGWAQEDKDSTEAPPNGVAYDPVNRKLFVITSGWSYVFHNFQAVTMIDIDTWTIEKYWDYNTDPHFNIAFKNEDVGFYIYRYTNVYNGKLAFPVMQDTAGDDATIAILDSVNDEIKYWNFHDRYSSGELAQNVTWNGQEVVIIPSSYLPESCQTLSNGDVWIIFKASWSGYGWIQVGHINIEDGGPNYNLTEVIRSDTSWHRGIGVYSISMFRVFEDEGYFFVLSGNFNSPNKAQQKINIYLTSGSKVTSYLPSDVVANNWPNAFIWDGYLIGRKFYFTFYINETSRRGLGVFDLDDEWCTYIEPTWVHSSNWRTINYAESINTLMITSNDGLITYNILTGEWNRFNNDTMPNLIPDGSDGLRIAHYDETNDLFMAGVTSHKQGAVAFKQQGKINQVNYQAATEDGGWTFGEENLLIKGLSAYGATTAYPAGSNEVYALWTKANTSSATYSLKWDKDEASADITSFLSKEHPISLNRAVDGNPAELSFVLSNGDKFDRHNLYSMLRPYVAKGRKLVLQLGDKYNGTNYFEPQGVYYITDTKISYQREDYPVISINASDGMMRLENMKIEATDVYSNVTPEQVFVDLATTYGQLDEADEVITPSFLNSRTMSPQFFDQTLKEMFILLCWRFGYMPRFNMDGKLEAFYVASETVDHAYGDNTKVIEFTPDDSYSDFTNRVTVTGISDQLVQVIHDEERVANIAGSIGWWGQSKDYKVYYSEDKEKRVVNPRLDVISSAESISFQLAGGVSETLKDVDPFYKYCIVEVKAPNLIPALVAAIAGYYVATEYPDAVAGYVTKPVGRVIEGIFLFTALNILGSIVNFQYDIYGSPLGLVERTIQNSADDEDFQNYIGYVVEEIIEGWECFDVNDCYFVAVKELNVVKYQRSRVKFKKIAHLKDEEGDTISVKHPISGQTIKVYITNLVRTLSMGEEGSFIDEIEGWVL